jgi:hypothetical protein
MRKKINAKGLEALQHLENSSVRKTAFEILDEAAKTFKQRNSLYKDNYKHSGNAFLSIFPGRKMPVVKNERDANRLILLQMAVGKLMRYAYNFEEGGHQDSVHDAAVYCAMLEELTEENI